VLTCKKNFRLEQILRYHHDEKILVFYEGDNTAYYIAQCLELLHITHLIYAKSLSSEHRARYIVAFDENPRIRVLLMDVRCGAEGLNVNKASRVFFINPCCRPNMEAQAIKRSHRIGQTKPVHVETLILKGTIEEAMFKRAKAMTETEHQQAKELADDTGIASILQNSKPLAVGPEDLKKENQMAIFRLPQQIFGREGRGNNKIKGIDAESDGKDGKKRSTKKRKTEQKVNAEEAAVPTTPSTQSASVFIPPPKTKTTPDSSKRESIFGGG
jgi:superfamily II DNA or RNA helicase